MNLSYPVVVVNTFLWVEALPIRQDALQLKFICYSVPMWAAYIHGFTITWRLVRANAQQRPQHTYSKIVLPLLTSYVACHTFACDMSRALKTLNSNALTIHISSLHWEGFLTHSRLKVLLNLLSCSQPPTFSMPTSSLSFHAITIEWTGLQNDIIPYFLWRFLAA